MKIDREGKAPLVIGKRVTFGGIVGGIVSTGSYLAELNGTPIPAPVAVALTTVITGIGQIWLVNRYGITRPE